MDDDLVLYKRTHAHAQTSFYTASLLCIIFLVMVLVKVFNRARFWTMMPFSTPPYTLTVFLGAFECSHLSHEINIYVAVLGYRDP